MQINQAIIRNRFNAASKSYNEVACVHRQSTEALITMLREFAPQFNPTTILDAGAGTGHTSLALLQRYPNATFTINDIAPNMLRLAKIKLEKTKLGLAARQQGFSPSLNFCEADMASNTTLANGYDLIISNMAIHWTSNITATLTKFHNKCRVLAFTCPLYGTFREWSELLERYGLIDAPLHDCPIESEVMAALASLHTADYHTEVKEFQLETQSPHSFMHYLRKLGASASESHVCHPHRLAQLIRNHALTFKPTYKILFAIITHK